MESALRAYLSPVRMARMEKTNETSCWKDAGEKGPLVTVGGECRLMSHFGNNNKKNWNTMIQSSYMAPGYITQRKLIYHRIICTSTFV